jgi:hypothetical protein
MTLQIHARTGLRKINPFRSSIPVRKNIGFHRRNSLTGVTPSATNLLTLQKWAKAPRGLPNKHHNISEMTNQSETAEGAEPHPCARLRDIVNAEIDRLTNAMKNDALSSVEREKNAKTLSGLAKLARFLFDPESASARKTGDELKKEDDAIRAEFARRLAAILRGRDIRRGAEAHGAGTQAPDAA